VRQQNSGAVEDFLLPYSAVYLRIQKWKNYWNRSTSAIVIEKIKWHVFMAHGVFPETRVIGLHFCCCMYGSIFIQFCAVGCNRRIFSAPECVLAVQGRSGSSKVDDFGTNRKRVCDFLLVCHCDYGPILHRFWDTATYWLKIAYFSYPSASLPMFPLKFCSKVKHEETRIMGLSSSEDPMIVAWVVLTQCQRVTDRQTDRRTDLL